MYIEMKKTGLDVSDLITLIQRKGGGNTGLLIISTLLLILVSCNKDKISDDTPTNDPDHIHSFGEWTVKNPTSCTEQGSEERICACGIAESRLIEPIGHSMGEWEIVTPANCVKAGTMQRASGDAIAYVESTDQYAIMVDDRVEYYNANFGYVRSFRIFNFGNGPYKICADDNYVYVMFVANDGTNRNVHVYLHNGIALGEVAIKKNSGSNPTGISMVDGYLYISVPESRSCTLLKKLG